jgi:hypothetical protein
MVDQKNELTRTSSSPFFFVQWQILFITCSSITSLAGSSDAGLCFEDCWLRNILSSNSHINTKTYTFAYENIFGFYV